MSLFQILSISSLTLILAWIGVQMFLLVRPRLTLATTLLFMALVCFGFFCYFGVLSTCIDESLDSSAQLRLREVTFNGLIVSMALVVVLGALGLIFLAAEYRIRQITKRR